MTRIYQLDTIETGDLDATHLTVSEDSAGVETVQLSLGQLAQYLFNMAATDGNNPFGAFTNEIAIGTGAVANQEASVAIGPNCTASGYSSLAIGQGSTASAYAGVACGYYNLVAAESSIAAGYYNTVGVDSETVYAAAFGSQNTVSAYDIPGNYCTAVGQKNVVFGPDGGDDVPEGFNGKSIAAGYKNFVAGCYNTAVGHVNTMETEGFVFGCTAVGFKNTCSGYYACTAVGWHNTSSAPVSCTLGSYNIANELSAVAVGNNNTASGSQSACFGYNNTASGSYSFAAGFYNSASNNNSVAFGVYCTANNTASTACGYRAMARIPNTTNIAGPIIVRGDNEDGFSASQQFTQYAGVQNILMTSSIDLTGTSTTEIDLPSGCAFYVDEVGIILDTDVNTITVAPTVSFGWNGDSDGILAVVQTVNLIASASRQIYNNLLTYDGQTTLVFAVTSGGTATSMNGRAYFKGILVENSPV